MDSLSGGPPMRPSIISTLTITKKSSPHALLIPSEMIYAPVF
ncbi:MAG: hypothetical protein PHO13_07825 [Fermentimonas sp.]|nr:hypothetical protein [Fermentimonas sp.]MDD3189392.1 hypothetical protein [Fermentimonas sp.]